MKKILLVPAFLILAGAVQATETHPPAPSKYAGQEGRAIKSLSPDDIAELRRGGGWGLARVAELNGVPGPAHLLEMKAETSLDDTQVAALEKILEQMKTRAVRQGEKLIDLERSLEDKFRDRTITDASLRTSLRNIADARMELRYVHLSAHLKTPDILSEDQIKTYNTLRGYDNPDPCANIPEGHDADVWRKHNGCK